MATSPLKSEFEFYLSKQSELARTHKGEFVLIVGDNIIGFYPSEVAAYHDAIQKYAVGTFLIERCVEGSEHYTKVFHTGRVSFA